MGDILTMAQRGILAKFKPSAIAICRDLHLAYVCPFAAIYGNTAMTIVFILLLVGIVLTSLFVTSEVDDEMYRNANNRPKKPPR